MICTIKDKSLDGISCNNRLLYSYFSQIFITYVDHDITFSQFEDEMREICGFQKKVGICDRFENEISLNNLTINILTMKKIFHFQSCN